ncbi:secondary thiamine-phosphate synthase enzyme [Clostridium cavendishii DSM 21758]|uniref:Secondary thiamine-phosphate synthase enzyme n=2 Tax=Clostridium TaxID=1485 RepID=A0A1M6FLD6_9CLOT|nr:secondary thiamine-phosphate synthase enzyme [Clostridium cavendishii DSM 21758]
MEFMNNLFKYNLTIDKKEAMVNITEYVNEAVLKSNIKNGIVVVYSPHTTAGITINENTDPDVVTDMLYGFEKNFPTKDRIYRHYEGNSHAHLKTSSVGASQSIILNKGELILGTWQAIYFCEFDGPRTRNFFVKVLEG